MLVTKRGRDLAQGLTSKIVIPIRTDRFERVSKFVISKEAQPQNRGVHFRRKKPAYLRELVLLWAYKVVNCQDSMNQFGLRSLLTSLNSLLVLTE